MALGVKKPDWTGLPNTMGDSECGIYEKWWKERIEMLAFA